jgi:hypothetical protein
MTMRYQVTIEIAYLGRDAFPDDARRVEIRGLG